MNATRHRSAPGVVLVVDDDPGVRRAASRILRDEGYLVWEAENGAQALLLLAEHQPNTVLLDIMMPVLDGHGFLKGIGNGVPGYRPRVVLTTGMRDLDPSRAATLGAEAFLAKPFRPDELLRKVALATFRSRHSVPVRHEPVPRAMPLAVFVSAERPLRRALTAALADAGVELLQIPTFDPGLPRLLASLAPRSWILDFDTLPCDLDPRVAFPGVGAPQLLLSGSLAPPPWPGVVTLQKPVGPQEVLHHLGVAQSRIVG